jgi:hypothetical protein
MVSNNDWVDDAACQDFDTELFFDKYEEDISLRPEIDEFCGDCPVSRQCFAIGVSQKSWGVHGGIYLEDGKISRQFNKHRTKQDWANKWKQLTMDN